MSTLFAAALIAAIVLALVHVITPLLRFLAGTPRSIWLSIAGGVSVAYVFVHLLPELAAGQEEISRATRQVRIHFAERHVYLIALIGLATFYGLDKLAKQSRLQESESAKPGTPPAMDPEAAATTPTVFWIHMTSFGLYNALIGYLLLHREVPGLQSLAFFAVAMALHFFVTDRGLDDDNKWRFRQLGRWLLVIAVFVGLSIGAAVELPKAAVAVLVAFLAGGVILNVLKEEVPGERRSRFWAFALGMAAYAVLLLTF